MVSLEIHGGVVRLCLFDLLAHFGLNILLNFAHGSEVRMA